MQAVEARLAPLRLLVESRELLTEALFGADTPRRLDLNGEPFRILVRDRLQQRPEATLEPDLDEALGGAATTPMKSASLFSK